MPNQGRLKKKFNLLFLSLSIVPILILGISVYLIANLVLRKEAYNKLTIIRNNRARELDNYFRNLERDIDLISGSNEVRYFINDIEKEFPKQQVEKNEKYNEIMAKHQENFVIYKAKYEFENIMMFSTNGKLLFSLNSKSASIGDNIFEIIQDRKKIDVYNAAKRGLAAVSDIFRESISGRDSLLAGIPIFADGVLKAVLIAEVRTDKINEILSISTEGEESLLIGEEYGIKILKNNSRMGSIGDPISDELSNYLSNSINDLKKYTINGKKYFITKMPLNYSRLSWVIVVWIPVEIIYDWIYKLRTFYVLFALGLIFVTWYIVRLIVKKSVYPIEELAMWAEEVASGNLELREIQTGNDEIGNLNTNMKKLVTSLKKIAHFAQAVSVGDLTKTIELRSERDLLGKSVNQMKENFKSAVLQTNSLAEEDYFVNIEPKSENDEMAFSLIKLVNQLKLKTDDSEKHKWMIVGRNELNEKIKGEKSVHELSKIILDYIIPRVEAEVGTFYIKSDDRFSLASTYAFTLRKEFKPIIEFGEGIVGQTAIEKKLIIIKDLPDDYMIIKSSLGERAPANLCVIPCLYNDEIECIIEIASLKEFSEIEIQYLKNISESIAIAIHSAHVNKEMKDVLDKAIYQAKELQQQQQELKKSNIELEKQATFLKESEEKLQAQQEELRVINEELEEKNKSLERQKEEIYIKNKELNKTKEEIEEKAEELEAASRYKSEFLANMSHELRTPLNSILILSQLLYEKTEGKLAEEEREYSKIIHSSGTDLLNLINDILDLSKIEAGKMDVNFEFMQLREIERYIKNTFTQIAKQKGLELRTEILDNLSERLIETDHNKLLQVIRNLYSNALKFTRTGEIVLTIRKSPRDSEEPLVEIAVSDTGIGIPTEKKRLIFEAFQQVDGTISRQYGGTGLGLSISRELSRILKGDISVESEEGKGSKFIITLPLTNYTEDDQVVEKVAEEIREEKEEIRKERKNKEKISKETVEIKDEKSSDSGAQESALDFMEKNASYDLNEGSGENEERTILIIDDDAQFLHVLSDIARNKKFRVFTATEGEGGLILANEKMPDAIILDLGLPGIDGWEVLEKLRANSKTKNIPVHIMSASDKPEVAERASIVEYIQKPVTVAELDSMFSKVKKLKNIKKLIIAENDLEENELLEGFVKKRNPGVDIVHVATGKDLIEKLGDSLYDCVILDLGIDGDNGIELLEKIRTNDISQTPIVTYTDKKLTVDEDARIKKYAETIVVKGPKYMDRLLDEVKLFLHHLDKEVPEKKIKEPRKTEIKTKTSNPGKSLSGKRLLLVDDDVRNLFALSSVLENNGAKVSIARNGIESIEKFQQEELDLILMDIMMPEMDGYTAMRKIRGLEKGGDIPIIALTAKAMKEDREKCIEAGANDYMSKPVDIEKLLSLLRVWLY